MFRDVCKKRCLVFDLVLVLGEWNTPKWMIFVTFFEKYVFERCFAICWDVLDSKRINYKKKQTNSVFVAHLWKYML